MATVRTLFYQALEKEVITNPAIKESFNHLKCFKLMRLFDNIRPCWLDSKTVSDYTYQYKMVLLSIKSTRITSDSIELSDVRERNLVERFEKQIIRMACDDLLDRQGNIKQEILLLMECKKQLTDKDIHPLLCAYVSAIHQEIYAKCAELSGDYINSLNGFNSYFKEKYSTWIIDVWSERNKHIDINSIDPKIHMNPAEHANFYESLLNTKIDKNVAIGVGVGASILTGLAVAGVFLIKALVESNSGALIPLNLEINKK